MTDVTKAIKTLKTLRVQSEGRRTTRLAARDRQDAPRVAAARPGGVKRPPQAAKKVAERSKLAKRVNLNDALGLKRGGPLRGPLHPLATQLDLSKKPRLNQLWSKAPMPSPAIESNRKYLAESGYRATGEHPYVDPAPPVAFAASMDDLKPEVSTTEAVHTAYGPGMLVKGREYLSQVNSGGSTFTSGNTVVMFPLNPSILMQPRLQKLAALYTRYIFKKVVLSYTGNAGTQNNGSLSIFGYYDPTTNPCVRPGDTLMSYSTNRGGSDFSLWESCALEMNDNNYKDLLYIEADGDMRWTLQGVMVIIASGDIAASVLCGKLVLDYELVLANDDLVADADLTTRNYRGATFTFGTWTAGTAATGTNTVVVPPAGKYSMVFRSDPTAARTAYKDLDAYQRLDANELYTLQKGTGCYAYIDSAGTVTLCPEATLWSPDPNSNEVAFICAAGGGVSTVTVDYLRLADED